MSDEATTHDDDEKSPTPAPDEPHPREPSASDQADDSPPIELAPKSRASLRPSKDSKDSKDSRPAAASEATSTTKKPLSAAVSAGLAVLSGVLYWAAFPGTDVWPFAFVCWAPLIIALRRQTPRRALWLGALQGLTCNLIGFYWLFGMLKSFSGFNDLLCGLFMVILCGYQGGRMGLLGWFYARAERKGWPMGLSFALAFIGHETAYPLLFPWFTGAQTHKVPLLMQLAEIGGPIAIGLALAGGSVAVAELVLAKMDARPVDRRRLAFGLAGPIVLVAFGAIRVPMVQKQIDAAPKAIVAVVQGNMPLGGGKDAVAIHHDATLQLEKTVHPDLIVWSEAAIPQSFPEKDMERLLSSYVLYGVKTPVVAGIVISRKREGAKRPDFYNSSALVMPGGKVTGTYDKTYLLAFGEYIPFGDWFPSLYEISKNSGQLTKGSSLASLPFGEHKITTLICYEDIIPSFTNAAVRAGDPDLLVNMTNDAWFGKSTEPAIHLALAKFRAVEHRRYLVRATNTGVSAWIDPIGRSTGETPLFELSATAGEVRWMRSRTVYELIGDVPWWLATLAIFAMGFVSRAKLFGREATS